jgi:glutaredoxin 1
MQRLELAMQRYTIFGHQACGFCRQAKAVLESKELPFRYVDIHKEGISSGDLAATVGKPVNTVPQIFHGEEHLGGYQELMQYLEQQVVSL